MAGLGAHVALVIDGGRADGSLASTLLDLTGATPRLLRAGVVTAEAIESVIGPIDQTPARTGRTRVRPSSRTVPLPRRAGCCWEACGFQPVR